MKDVLKIGDKQQYKRVVTQHDLASFLGETMHPVYATFALARDAEWTSRQFAVKTSDEDEEGIGTLLVINHLGPAFVSDEVVFTATVEKLERNEIICSYEAIVGNRLIATGKTGQKILKRDRIREMFVTENYR